MVVWIASYPRSGNTFFRVLLHHVFGFQTYTVYSVANDATRMREDTETLMRLVGQPELECNVDVLRSDANRHFVKTHDLPSDDSPAIVLIRDGRDAVVSYAHFILKTEHGIEQPGSEALEKTLEAIIDGDLFGGWSRNVNAWLDRGGCKSVIRYEDLIEDPVRVVTAALGNLGIDHEMNGPVFPSFHELHAIVPWFFRRGKSGSWREGLTPRLQELFMARHGQTLVRLGYSEATPSRHEVSARKPPFSCAADRGAFDHGGDNENDPAGLRR
jgi:hypothetical protein